MKPTQTSAVSLPPGEAGYAPDAEGILVRVGAAEPPRPPTYDDAHFELLRAMQGTHYWYRARHRFVLGALRRHVRAAGLAAGTLRGVDIGGGCGAWVRHLRGAWPGAFAELALADPSRRALAEAGAVAGAGVRRYQVDALDLDWRGRWDVAFLLDVLEHIPADAEALRRVGDALAPGGLALVTAPALPVFWSAYDAMAGHRRRYARRDLAALGERAGLRLRDARYFMFCLSAGGLLRRLTAPGARDDASPKAREWFRRVHRVPPRPLNALCAALLAADSGLGLRLRFPWGMSILGVFEKP